MIKSKVLITGASGFIGSYLLPYLLKNDYAVIALTRQEQPNYVHPSLTWIRDYREITKHDIDYVINLAGENIAAKRWTEARKQQLIDSRVDTTKALFQFLEKNQIQPKVVISGSAVGYYGIDHTEQWAENFTENNIVTPHHFSSMLCDAWEREAKSHDFNTKIIRLGVVFAYKGGILSRMLLPIKLNLFNKIGHGRQPVPWIHIQDVLSAIEFLMTKPTTTDTFNLVAPERMHQAQFARIASELLRRNPWFNLPAGLLNMMLGEQSELVLNGQFVKPKALLDAGFVFQFPTLKQALQDILS